MKFISFNVNGIRAILKKDFSKDFEAFNADIFALQETKFTEDLHLNFPFEPKGYEVYWTNSKVKKGYSGVAIFTKNTPISVHYGLLDHKYDEEGRAITLEFENFYFVSAYVPNSGEELVRLGFRMEFEKNLKEYLVSLNKKKPVVYCGDLNVAHNEIDIKNPKANVKNAGFTKEEREKFGELLDAGFVDTFRMFNKEGDNYTWWSYRYHGRAKNLGWRLDYFFVNKEFKNKVISAGIESNVMGSDHCPITLELDL